VSGGGVVRLARPLLCVHSSLGALLLPPFGSWPPRPFPRHEPGGPLSLLHECLDVLQNTRQLSMPSCMYCSSYPSFLPFPKNECVPCVAARRTPSCCVVLQLCATPARLLLAASPITFSPLPHPCQHPSHALAWFLSFHSTDACLQPAAVCKQVGNTTLNDPQQQQHSRRTPRRVPA